MVRLLHNHYSSAPLKEGQLAFVDCGAVSPMNYPGDMTRTFPVNQSFSACQKEMFQVVRSNSQFPAICTPSPMPQRNTIGLKLNGKPVQYCIEKGYAVLKQKWKNGDRIKLDMPMETDKVLANKNVKDDIGKCCFQRGPLVYSLEGFDNKDNLVHNILVDKTPPQRKQMRQVC